MSLLSILTFFSYICTIIEKDSKMARKKDKRKTSSLSETLGFNTIFHNEKLNFVIGLLLLVMAGYMILAFTSFFTTGAADQTLIEMPR